MTGIIRALMTRDVRLSTGSRWLVFDEINDEWVIYEHKYRARNVTEVAHAKDQEVAIKALLQE